MSHWHNKTTPTGDYIELRENILLPFNGSLFERVFTTENLKRAWQQVRSNKYKDILNRIAK